MLRLSQDPSEGEEYLGFRVGAHLSGEETPFIGPDGAPLSGADLDAYLRREGYGIHVVRIEGRYAPEDRADLEAWTRTTQIAGPLDHQTLGRTAHAIVRHFTETTHTASGGTLPEVYVGRLTINPVTARKQVITIRGKPRTIYRDARGRFAKKP